MPSPSLPRVSVVIPARDEARFIAEAVKSVLGQDLDGVELIVVDDGSRDGTAAVAQAACRGHARVVSQPPRGLPAARNRGLAEARAPYVLFLDADDRLAKGALGRLLSCAGSRNDVVVAYGEARIFDEEGRPLGAAPPPLLAPRPSGDALPVLLAGNFITSMGAALVKAETLRDLGGLREELRREEDWEVWCRLATRGAYRYCGPEVVLEKRRRRGSMSSTFGGRYDEAAAVAELVFSLPEVQRRFSAAERARLHRRQLAFQHAIAGLECFRQGAPKDARRHLATALRLDPRRPREWVLFACSLMGRLPTPIARRLK